MATTAQDESFKRAFAGIREWTTAMEHLAAALNIAAESLRNSRLADAIDETAAAVREIAERPPVSEADLRELAGQTGEDA